MQLLKIKNRYLLCILIPTFLFFFGYWLKGQLGINFFDSLSIGSYSPFRYLTNDTIISPPKGTFIDEDFEKINLVNKWSNSGLNKYTSVSRELSTEGLNRTKCLLIKNSNEGYWVYSHNKKIETKIGDVFYYEGLVNIKGNRLHAYFSIAASDESKKVISWNLFKGEINKIGSWIKVKKTITISNNRIKFITFRLVGVGRENFDSTISSSAN